MKRVVLLFVLVVCAVVVGLEPLHAIASELETWCKANGQSWDSQTSRCAVGESVSIGHGETLAVQHAESLYIDGTVTNQGVIDNAGTVHTGPHSGTLLNNGVIDNTGSIDGYPGAGTITNTGTIRNHYYFYVADSFTNSGRFTNNNSLEISGTMVNDSAGHIENAGNILSMGPFTNDGILVNNSSMANSGTFTNTGTIYNHGSISGWPNIGVFTNAGTIFNLCGGVIDVPITNPGDGVIYNLYKCVYLPAVAKQALGAIQVD